MATPMLSKEPSAILFNTEKLEEMKDDNEKWVLDSSVDHKGNVPVRATTGAWKAALFIIAIEFGERLSFFGLSANLMIYLTKYLHEDLKTAATTVNYWTGVTTMLPLVGGFIADAYLGRFSTILFSAFIYIGGLGLLILSQLAPSLKPCTISPCHGGSLRLHKIIFFLGLYLISIASGGHRPSLESFGADQFDDDHPKERKKKMSYFNWWNFGLCSGLLLGVTVIVYIQDNISFWVSYVVLTVVTVIALAIFLFGRPFYRHRVPKGSTLTPMIRVLVAALKKRHLPHPSNTGELYEVSNSVNSEKRRLSHTNQFMFLNKASIIEHRSNQAGGFEAEKHMNPWRLATVTQVEELKLIMNMIPIWLATIPFGISVAQISTFFLKQCAVMDRRLTGNFEVPPASVYALGAIGMIICVSLYDRILVPLFRRLTGNERGISILQRIGVGIVFSGIAMVTAAIVEAKRLRIAHEEQSKVVSMSVFWLAPQFVILGFGDGFSLVGLQEYFYDQVPDSMRSLGIGFYLSVIGASNFLSSLLITVVDHLTEKAGAGGSWFAKDLNKSRLDKFFWLLAAMDAVNVVVYVLVARRYSYKSVQHKVGVANSPDGDEDDPKV
ncbi:LOW QUALITY PROTEIN: protein NRT1/ PTR FAMILY 5.6-like [Dioscorea cayenensis subsp. rotundata]|uniref:LOW QUALITY PROTEIN: protein NRT1/ PTR FAMILY 5.6-like n=1 Tax=Dioscorea cayennensis subsp. rotundata TaxID=55577 RepID=A0AB40C890_DIOCR|nr:LOW QUALITY PROTEIN: protein NRT1/ PTR FAMILY 5.6-like [Dioscorea cayenensis subsp. rotundata]